MSRTHAAIPCERKPPMKTKRTNEELVALNREALSRAEQSESWSNYPAIFAGFAERGIPISQTDPIGGVR